MAPIAEAAGAGHATAAQILPVIRKALEAGGNQRFEAVELPGLNHLFQNAKTGAVVEAIG